MNTLRTKRSSVDWSKHEFKIWKDKRVTIFSLEQPHTTDRRVTFINHKYGVDSGLTVTGDYGNWVFCREFHPSSDGYVSDDYWLEKLSIGSCQKPGEYDSKKTVQRIKEFYKDRVSEKSYYSKEDWFELKEWVRSLLMYSDDEVEYTYYAYREKPDFIEYESVPFVKDIKIQLKIVFDAFEEMCRRMGETES